MSLKPVAVGRRGGALGVVEVSTTLCHPPAVAQSLIWGGILKGGNVP